jgi:hypothetical protein
MHKCGNWDCLLKTILGDAGYDGYPTKINGEPRLKLTVISPITLERHSLQSSRPRVRSLVRWPEFTHTFNCGRRWDWSSNSTCSICCRFAVQVVGLVESCGLLYNKSNEWSLWSSSLRCWSCMYEFKSARDDRGSSDVASSKKDISWSAAIDPSCATRVVQPCYSRSSSVTLTEHPISRHLVQIVCTRHWLVCRVPERKLVGCEIHNLSRDMESGLDELLVLLAVQCRMRRPGFNSHSMLSRLLVWPVACMLARSAACGMKFLSQLVVRPLLMVVALDPIEVALQIDPIQARMSFRTRCPLLVFD